MPSIKVKSTREDITETQILIQQLGEGQLRFSISTKCPGDAGAGPPTGEEWGITTLNLFNEGKPQIQTT